MSFTCCSADQCCRDHFGAHDGTCPTERSRLYQLGGTCSLSDKITEYTHTAPATTLSFGLRLGIQLNDRLSF
jgi:hypothetical protein